MWFALFIGITAVIVFFGVEKGIEKVSKFMMPLLVVLILGIVINTAILPLILLSSVLNAFGIVKI